MTRSSRKRRQRGSVSVEMALVMPLIVITIIGGVHFGRVLMIRHKLSEATNSATRSAAIAGDTNANRIRGVIQARMGTNSGCDLIQVRTRSRRDALGVRQLEVTTECRVNTGLGGALLGAVGPDQLDVTVAMPY